jgi:hypothetical protein
VPSAARRDAATEDVVVRDDAERLIATAHITNPVVDPD